MNLKTNKVAPNFKLPSTDNSTFELKKNKKKISFYTFTLKTTPQVVH